MGYTENLMGSGLASLKAKLLGNRDLVDTPAISVATGLVSTGTTITDALLLTKLINVFATVGASTGVKLNAKLPIGASIVIDNRGANVLNLFPHSASGTINGGTAGSAVTIAVGAVNKAIKISNADWLVVSLAKES